MKTLDEVIRVLNESFGDGRYNMVPLECEPEYGEEALRYLNEYKNTDENYKIAIAHVTEVIDYYEKMIADYLADNNPALTWDELKQMKGKPVWVEEPSFFGKRWVILSGMNSEAIFGTSIGSMVFYTKDEQGTEWQAYRKERE